MSGTVNGDLEALFWLTIQDAGGQLKEVEGVLDTGFNGFLTLPVAVVSALDLPWLCRQEGLLADGSTHAFDVYVATVIWDGKPRSVEVEAVDAQPLLGMALMQGMELRIRVTPGGSVTLTPFP